MSLSQHAAEELASTIAAPLGGAGAAFYFHPDTLAKGKELGLGGMKFYFLGRGGVLGNVSSDVVASAFGYFHPDSAAALWDSASEKLAPREAGTIYHECAAHIGRTLLADVPDLDAYNDAAAAAIAATDRAGLTLFAGIAAEPVADDAPGRALQLSAVLRELRGSAHLNALLSTGIVPHHSHCHRRPEMAGAFGWDPAPDTSNFDEDLLAEAEALTNKLVGVGFTSLSEEQAAALSSGAAAIGTACGVE